MNEIHPAFTSEQAAEITNIKAELHDLTAESNRQRFQWIVERETGRKAVSEAQYRAHKALLNAATPTGAEQFNADLAAALSFWDSFLSLTGIYQAHITRLRANAQERRELGLRLAELHALGLEQAITLVPVDPTQVEPPPSNDLHVVRSSHD